MAVLLLLALSVLALVLSSPPPAHAASELVQQTSFNDLSASHSSFAVSLPSNVAQGDVLVIAVSTQGSVPPNAVTDTRSSSFTDAVSAPFAGSDASIWVAALPSSGSDTVTVTFGSIQNVDIYAFEVSGVTTAGAATATGGANGCSNFPSCTDSFSTSSSASFSSGAFLLGIIDERNGPTTNTLSTGAGFTQSGVSPDDEGYAEYSLSGVTSPTNFPASITTIGMGTYWSEAGVALDPPASVPEFPFALALPAMFLAGAVMYLFARSRVGHIALQ